MASEETFEPIAIDFGFEDSVAFDSDQEINFDQGENYYDQHTDESSKASATRGHLDKDSEVAIKAALNEQCGLDISQSPKASPHLSPSSNRRLSVQFPTGHRSSICQRNQGVT